MTDQELRIFGKQVKQARKKIAELNGSEADQRKQYFKIIRALASRCVDDQGRVHWDFLEQALSEDGSITLTPYPANGT